jgi:hypothetical protein
VLAAAGDDRDVQDVLGVRKGAVGMTYGMFRTSD